MKVKAASKSAMYSELAAQTGLAKKDVAGVFDALSSYIHTQVGKKGPGVFTLPGLLKVKRVEKPATKPRQGRNPATGEMIMIPAKPKRTVVKALCLKALKESVK
jgi:nucleoid DNA-binding protein